jgi:hypothetical protein
MNPKAFVAYCWSFYGPGQVHGDFFDHTLTLSELRRAARIQRADPTYAADSLDREHVRDIMLAERGKL